MNSSNILKKITYEIYKKRPMMPEDQRTNYRIERANGGLLCDLWFLTRGCTHDASGGCTMCNYGKGGRHINEKIILEELERIAEKLPWEFEDFLLTSSGSLLDEGEVPLEFRKKLIPILKKVRAKRVIIETRADTITDSGLQFVKEVVPEAEKYIEIGVESTDDWILKYCINKGSTFRIFQQAAKKIHDSGFLVTANLGLGAPFLNERASVRSTVQSIRDVMLEGADSIVLFPYHVKRGTLVDVMYQSGMYTPVSLWALAEVLSHFSEEELSRIQISWYKDYFGEEKSYIYQSPGTCPACEKEVIRLLDQFRDGEGIVSVRKLSRMTCGCKEKWRERMAGQKEEIELEKVQEDYRRLAEMYKIDQGLLESELDNMQRDYVRRYC